MNIKHNASSITSYLSSLILCISAPLRDLFNNNSLLRTSFLRDTKAIFLLFFISLTITYNTYSQEKTLKSGQTYIYTTEYIDLAKDLIIHDTIKLVINDNPWKSSPKRQKEMIWVYPTLQDTAILAEIYTLGNVRYDTTGYIENESVLFLHPPRHQHYTIIELAPFPEISLPLEEGKEYQKILFTSSGWGDYSQIKFKNKYLIKERLEIEWNNESINAWNIHSESHSEIGISTADFIFDNQKGFIEIDYQFFNDIEIKIKLLEIN